MQSVARAFALLEIVGATPDGARLSDIAAAAGLNRSTTHNLLATLESLDYVAQPTSGGRYVLTDRLAELGRGAADDDALRTRYRPALEAIAATSGETCYLAVPARRDYVYLDAIESPRPLKLTAPLGTRDPLLGTAIGHILLAFRPATSARLAREDPAGWARWRAHVDTAREDGYAIDLEDAQREFCCVAVPITEAGHTRAALGVAGPASRLPLPRLRELTTVAVRALADAGPGA